MSHEYDCATCAARRDLIDVLCQRAWVVGEIAKWIEEGWAPDPACDECGGRGWRWADPLLPGNTALHPRACPCSF